MPHDTGKSVSRAADAAWSELRIPTLIVISAFAVMIAGGLHIYQLRAELARSDYRATALTGLADALTQQRNMARAAHPICRPRPAIAAI